MNIPIPPITPDCIGFLIIGAVVALGLKILIQIYKPEREE